MKAIIIVSLTALLLFFPVCFSLDLCLFLKEKRAFWSARAYGVIAVGGGELHEERGKIQVFRKRKLAEIPLADFLKENKAKFDVAKGFLLSRVHGVIQIGSENYASAVFLSHGVSVWMKAVISFFRTNYYRTSYRVNYVVLPEKEGISGVFHAVFWFTPLLLIIALTKTLLNKGLEYVQRKKQKQ